MCGIVKNRSKGANLLTFEIHIDLAPPYFSHPIFHPRQVSCETAGTTCRNHLGTGYGDIIKLNPGSRRHNHTRIGVRAGIGIRFYIGILELEFFYKAFFQGSKKASIAITLIAEIRDGMALPINFERISGCRKLYGFKLFRADCIPILGHRTVQCNVATEIEVKLNLVTVYHLLFHDGIDAIGKIAPGIIDRKTVRYRIISGLIGRILVDSALINFRVRRFIFITALMSHLALGTYARFLGGINTTSQQQHAGNTGYFIQGHRALSVLFPVRKIIHSQHNCTQKKAPFLKMGPFYQFFYLTRVFFIAVRLPALTRT